MQKAESRKHFGFPPCEDSEMITISTTPNGIRLTRGDERYTATSPAALGCLITQLTTSTPAAPAAPPPAPPSFGQRLAKARRRYRYV
jgi:hypothetical protein